VKKKGSKVLVLGLDGVGPQVFKWAKENQLLNIARIIKAGAYSSLRSTMPPLSPLAWPSFYTGTNPGKHGVLNFQVLTDKGFEIATFKSVAEKSLWRIMSEHGKKVIIVSVPITYPPEVVNGILISGMDAPNEEADFTYPKNLKEELKKEGYQIFVNRLLYSYPDVLIKEAKEVMWKKAEVALKLMRENDWDFFMLVLNETDVIAHFLPGKFLEFCKEADEIVGRFLAEIDKDTNVILMSDHGNIPFQGSINLNVLLKQQIKQDESLADRSIRRFNLLLTKAGAAKIRYRSKIVDRIAKLISRFLSKTRVTEIKYQGKDIHILGNGVYVFNKSMKEQVYNTLQEYSKKYDFKVFKREGIYSGKFVNSAPDFIVHSEKYIPSSGYDQKTIISPPKRPGWHSLFGILAVSGADVKNTEIKEAQIVDLAPTILHLMGLPVPREMDGRVLQEIFKEGSEAYKRPIRYQQIGEKEKIKAKIAMLKTSKRL